MLNSLHWLLCRMVGMGPEWKPGVSWSDVVSAWQVGEWWQLRLDPGAELMGEGRRGRGLLGLWYELCWLEGSLGELGTPGRGGSGGRREE